MANSLFNVQKEFDPSEKDFAKRWAELGDAIKMLNQGKIQINAQTASDGEDPVIPRASVPQVVCGQIIQSQLIKSTVSIKPTIPFSGHLHAKNGFIVIDLTPAGDADFNAAGPQGRRFVFVD